MITTYTFWGFIGLGLLLGIIGPLSPPESTPQREAHTEEVIDYYLSIETVAQKAYRVNDAGNQSELYFVFGSVLTDESAYTHELTTFTRRPDILVGSEQTRRNRVQIIANQMLRPAEYMVLNIGIMDEDCKATNRRALSRYFVPDYLDLPKYKPGVIRGLTPTWTGMMVGTADIPKNDIRRVVPPPTVDLESIQQFTSDQCTFTTGDDLQGYISIIAWNNPYAPVGSRMWDYYCPPEVCHVPPHPTGDTLVVHARYDNLHDITFRVTMYGY